MKSWNMWKEAVLVLNRVAKSYLVVKRRGLLEALQDEYK